MRAGIAAIDGLRVLGDGGLHLVAMAADPAPAAGRRVRARRRAAPPRAGSTTARARPTRCTRPSALATSAVIDEYLADLAAVPPRSAGAAADDRSTTYATLE